MIDHCVIPTALNEQNNQTNYIYLEPMLKQVFIDCMPGPTNHFGGHAFGNMASMTAKGQHSNPKKPLWNGLKK